ncbi:MAG: type II toxin-antitoxin system HicB family antitoxin [Cytophagales bacterium]|nr:type II toxin-antitoxin system HicB family antitoxin [Cytophagales bacterium]
MRYTVIYEQCPKSWGAYVPDLPGCVAVGDSKNEVAKLIKDAIEFHLEGMRKDNEPIPEPSSFADVVSV